MRKIIFILTILFVIPLVANAEQVDGYWRDSDGDGIKDKYVNPYNRSDRNDSTRDNYSTKGNTNPWTGKKGTKDYNDNDFNKSYPKNYDNPFDSNKSQHKQKNWFDID